MPITKRETTTLREETKYEQVKWAKNNRNAKKRNSNKLQKQNVNRHLKTLQQIAVLREHYKAFLWPVQLYFEYTTLQTSVAMSVSDWEKPGERWQGFPYELCGRDNRRKGYACPPLCGTCYNVKNFASVSEGTCW